jgi:hypothetical protein
VPFSSVRRPGMTGVPVAGAVAGCCSIVLTSHHSW